MHNVILGIDPGLKHTGFGVISVINHKLHYLGSGIISTNTSHTHAVRLSEIVTGLHEVIDTYNPNTVAVEEVFVNINPKSTLLLGQARGAAIAACAIRNLPVYEYTALKIKKTLSGYGKANKEQVQTMVSHLLQIQGKLKSDASDALACAITHHQYTRINIDLCRKATNHQ